VRNADKHARPSHVDVRLGRTDGAFWMEVLNDGVTSTRRRPGMGLRLAALEALQLNGVIEFGEREPGVWQVRLVVSDEDDG
jgi:signal transduction histidine kinase